MNKPPAVASVLFLILSLTITVAGQTSESNEGAELGSVVEVIREALKESQSNNVPGFPSLKSAEITLKSIVTKSSGGKVNFLIFTLGAKYESETASVLSLELMPPPTVNTATLDSALDTEKLKQTLARAINSAKAGVLEANRGTPRLNTSRIEIDVKFAVSKEGGSSARIELLPLGFEGTTKLAYSKVHSLKLIFSQ